MNTRVRLVARAALAPCMGALIVLGGCSASHTDVQVRNASDHSPLVGMSVGHLGPLHASYHWTTIDTDGLVHVHAKRDWAELPIAVAGPGHRIEATGVLRPHSDQWVALEPAPNSTQHIEARVVAGEGSVPPPPMPPE